MFWGACRFNRVIEESFPEKEFFDQRPDRGRERNHVGLVSRRAFQVVGMVGAKVLR